MLKAVLDAGADAVYLGGDQFGARAYAGNFTEEELLSALDYAHIRGKKVYLAVNTLLKNQELQKLYAYLLPYYKRGLDAVLVQDFGVLSCIRRWFPDLPVHSSTQMTITGEDGVRLLQSYGVSRVVMARETSLAEMKRIHENTGMELEAFVHGALCYSYSGQCLFSSMLGGRSGNRGRCAQPCRLSYQMGDKESYLLSLKDLCGIRQLEKLKEAGVYSLKIEGRMKQPSYAAGVVSFYRKYVDLLQEKPDHYQVSDEDMHTLAELGNRCGFTDTYFHAKNSKDMITRTKPSFSQTRTDLLPEKQYRAIRGEIRIQAGEPVAFTVSCPNAVASDGFTEVCSDEDSSVSFADSCPNAVLSVTVHGPIPDAAKKQPLLAEDVKQRLCKTGDTAFAFDEIAVDLAPGLFLTNGAVNQLKRDAIAALEEKILSGFTRNAEQSSVQPAADETVSSTEDGNSLSNDMDTPTEDSMLAKNHTESKLPQYAVSTENRDHLSILCAQDWVQAVYLDSKAYRRENFFETLAEDAAYCKECGKQPWFVLPTIFRAATADFYSKNLGKIKEIGFAGIVVQNYEELSFVREKLPEVPFLTAHNLYTYNNAAAAAFLRAGAIGNTVPLELNRKEIAGRDNRRSQMMLYGHYPLMVSAQCVNQNTGGCDNCPKTLYLTDRYRKRFPVKNYCDDCYNVIYNSLPTMLFPYMEECKRFGVESFLLSFTVESQKQVRAVCDLFKEFACGSRTEVPAGIKNRCTGGHYKRGVE
jgi:putative protease